MGFSVSGAAAIIFVSLFIAFGVWFTAASNSFGMVTDAQNDRAVGALEAGNTDIEIASATYNATTNTLTVEANNTGTTELSLTKTDLLVDGVYVSDWEQNATVENVSDTDLWLAGEQLSLSIEQDESPDRVKLATPSGVAASAEVVAE